MMLRYLLAVFCLFLASCAPVATTSVTSDSTFLASAVSADDACKAVDQRFASELKDMENFRYQGAKCYGVSREDYSLDEVVSAVARDFSSSGYGRNAQEKDEDSDIFEVWSRGNNYTFMNYSEEDTIIMILVVEMRKV